MKTDKILKLGDPKLYEISEKIEREELPEALVFARELNEIILEYRKLHNAGRAIAAPQIGYMKRMVCLNINKPFVLINPELYDMSDEMIELWDDCMSFPELMVKVRRHRSCKVRFKDENWEDQVWELEGDLSELLQHECDHLDGILAVHRAVDNRSYMLTTEWLKIKDSISREKV